MENLSKIVLGLVEEKEILVADKSVNPGCVVKIEVGGQDTYWRVGSSDGEIIYYYYGCKYTGEETQPHKFAPSERVCGEKMHFLMRNN